MQEFEQARLQAEIVKVLANPIRIVMIQHLKKNGPMTVTELKDLFDVRISAVSKHLKLLREYGIVQDEKKANKVYYTLSVPCITDFLGCTIEIAKKITGISGQFH